MKSNRRKTKVKNSKKRNMNRNHKAANTNNTNVNRMEEHKMEDKEFRDLIGMTDEGFERFKSDYIDPPPGMEDDPRFVVTDEQREHISKEYGDQYANVNPAMTHVDPDNMSRSNYDDCAEDEDEDDDDEEDMFNPFKCSIPKEGEPDPFMDDEEFVRSYREEYADEIAAEHDDSDCENEDIYDYYSKKFEEEEKAKKKIPHDEQPHIKKLHALEDTFEALKKQDEEEERQEKEKKKKKEKAKVKNHSSSKEPRGKNDKAPAKYNQFGVRERTKIIKDLSNNDLDRIFSNFKDADYDEKVAAQNILFERNNKGEFSSDDVCAYIAKAMASYGGDIRRFVNLDKADTPKEISFYRMTNPANTPSYKQRKQFIKDECKRNHYGKKELKMRLNNLKEGERLSKKASMEDETLQIEWYRRTFLKKKYARMSLQDFLKIIYPKTKKSKRKKKLYMYIMDNYEDLRKQEEEQKNQVISEIVARKRAGESYYDNNSLDIPPQYWKEFGKYCKKHPLTKKLDMWRRRRNFLIDIDYYEDCVYEDYQEEAKFYSRTGNMSGPHLANNGKKEKKHKKEKPTKVIPAEPTKAEQEARERKLNCRKYKMLDSYDQYEEILNQHPNVPVSELLPDPDDPDAPDFKEMAVRARNEREEKDRHKLLKAAAAKHDQNLTQDEKDAICDTIDVCLNAFCEYDDDRWNTLDYLRQTKNRELRCFYENDPIQFEEEFPEFIDDYHEFNLDALDDYPHDLESAYGYDETVDYDTDDFDEP